MAKKETFKQSMERLDVIIEALDRNEIELEDCPVCRGAGYIEDEQGWCMYACCLNCGTETAHVSYKTPEERLEAARQAAYLWNIGKVIHNGMCD